MYNEIKKFVKPFYDQNGLSHDYLHALLVFRNVQIICKKESIESEIAKISALFHDIIQIKDNSGSDVKASASIAREFLINRFTNNPLPNEVYNTIIEASWEFYSPEKPLSSIDSYILRDADFLESIGGHGLARVFSYSGENKIPFGFPPFIENGNSAFNHIKTKLQKIEKIIYFKSSLLEAEKRYQFIKRFLNQYETETEW